MRKVTVAGGGVLGSQIAFQCAYSGKDTTIWLRSEGSKTRTQPKLNSVKASYIEAIEGMAAEGASYALWARGICDDPGKFDKQACLDRVEKAYRSIKLECDLDTAFNDAELVIESMTEDPAEKTAFFQKIAPHLGEGAILVTNSSTLLPSQFADASGRPQKFLALHFANSIWRNNTAEVMAQAKTSPEAFDAVVEFAEEMNMIALPIHKEKSGYLLNSLLVPFLLSGLDLLANGVAEPEAIDKAWTCGTGAPKGPFQIIDTVGLQTTYHIVSQYQKVPTIILPGLLQKMMLPYNFKGMEKLLKEKIDAGKLGMSSGEGFYKYGDE